MTSTVAGVVGNNNPRAPGIEAALDIEYVMGVAQDVPAWFVIEAGAILLLLLLYLLFFFLLFFDWFSSELAVTSAQEAGPSRTSSMS